ncbi:hypothetical protein [uncultured Roseobacter sp.]|nr:hypothetical protein [uncultured Roseobacter sp.]
MFKRLFSAALVFGAAALAPPLAAQTACLPRSDLVNSLKSTYSEQMAGGGLQNASRLIEIWTSRRTGSFTIFITRPDGISCVVASGQDWYSVPQPIGEGVKG